MKSLETLSPASRWLYALKWKSWPKLLVPFFFGQAFGASANHTFSVALFFLGFCFTVFLLGFIVLMNDYADITVDTIKRRLFPKDCSPKTIPDQILSKSKVLQGALFFASLTLVLSGVADLVFGFNYIFGFALVCILVFLAYSLPPIQLNYRGGGELLEMMGVGCMLPLFHYSLQAGFTWGKDFLFLVLISTAFALASALASGLSDEVSDREGGKKTFVLLLGSKIVRRVIDILSSLSFFAFAAYLFWSEIFPSPFAIVFTLYGLYETYCALRLSPQAGTNEFEAQRFYKDHLHRLIWGSFVLVSLFQLVQTGLDL